jgi:hypothetical protein
MVMVMGGREEGHGGLGGGGEGLVGARLRLQLDLEGAGARDDELSVIVVLLKLLLLLFFLAPNDLLVTHRQVAGGCGVEWLFVRGILLRILGMAWVPIGCSSVRRAVVGSRCATPSPSTGPLLSHRATWINRTLTPIPVVPSTWKGRGSN